MQLNEVSRRHQQQTMELFNSHHQHLTQLIRGYINDIPAGIADQVSVYFNSSYATSYINKVSP